MSRLTSFHYAAQRFWSARAPRERGALVTAAAVITLLLGWALVWEPVSDWNEDQQQRLARTAENAAAVAGGRERLAADADTEGAGLPVAIVESSRSPMREARQIAERLEILNAIERREPTAQGGLRIRFGDLPFSKLVRWTAEMETKGLRVSRAEVRPVDTDEPRGRIRASMEMEPGNS